MRRLAVLVPLLTAALPAPASARLWHTHTLATRDQTFVRDLDALPDGRTVLVDERLHGSTHRLELRVGSHDRVLASGRHTFDGVSVDHDNSSRLTVAWAQVPDGE